MKRTVHRPDYPRLLEALGAAREEIGRQVRPLAARSGIAAVARQFLAITDDMALLITGNRDYFRPKDSGGLTGPAKLSPPKPADDPG